MRRLVLHFSILLLTFAIGAYANTLVIRAAYYFIPDVDRQPVQNVTMGINEDGLEALENLSARF